MKAGVMRSATNGSRLRCPRDGAALDVGAFHDEPLCKCPACNGAFFQQGSVLSLLKALSKDIRDTIPLDYPIETILDKGGGLFCPRCTAAMEHYAYMGDKHIMIDGCSACKHIWVDAEELAGMSLLHARSERLAGHRRTHAQRTERRRHGLVDAHMIAQAVGTAILTGSVGAAFLLYFALSEMDGDP